MVNWNQVFGHKWPDSVYDKTFRLLTNEEQLNSADAGYRTYRARTELYSVDLNSYPNMILLKVSGVLPWEKNDTFFRNRNFTFQVVRESDRKSILKQFFKDPKDLKLNPKTILDNILRNGYLGISRRYIENFLLSNDGVQFLREFKLQSVRPTIKSFRPQYPFEMWQMDFIHFEQPTLRAANNGYLYVLVIIDIFSKFVYLFPTKHQTELTIAKILNKIFLSGDVPTFLHSDNGSGFRGGNVLKDLCETFNVRRMFGHAYSPQTQGFVENKNKYIKNMITSHMIQYKTHRYVDVIDRIAFSINTTKHSVTGFTPMQIHRGRELNIQINDDRIEANTIELPNNTAIETHIDNETHYNQNRTNHVKRIFEQVGEKREAKQKEKYNGLFTYRHNSYIANMKVKVATYVKYMHRDMYHIKPMIILLVNVDDATDEKKWENPLRDSRQRHVQPIHEFKITELKRFEVKKEKWYPYTCNIASVIEKERGENVYTLRYIDNQTKTVYKVIRLEESVYDTPTRFEEFHRNQLISISEQINENNNNSNNINLQSTFNTLFDNEVVDQLQYRSTLTQINTNEGVPKQSKQNIPVMVPKRKPQKYKSLKNIYKQ
jgi:transposase InsO family protein